MTDDAAAPETRAGPARNPLNHLLGYQLRRASAAMLSDFAETFADIGLRVTEISIVLVIAENPGITQSEVGRLLGIQRANMAPLAAGLTESGWILRSRSDGRSQGLRLSESGREGVAGIWARIHTHEARFASDLNPVDRADFVKLVNRLWAGEIED